jgi:membrane protein implicated in regulation of membrane protease activity
MIDIGRLLMLLGGAVFVIGLLFFLGGRLPWFGNLPGDIVVKRDNFTLYAPIGTMIALSLLLTVVLNILARLFR